MTTILLQCNRQPRPCSLRWPVIQVWVTVTQFEGGNNLGSDDTTWWFFQLFEIYFNRKQLEGHCSKSSDDFWSFVNQKEVVSWFLLTCNYSWGRMQWLDGKSGKPIFSSCIWHVGLHQKRGSTLLVQESPTIISVLNVSLLDTNIQQESSKVSSARERSFRESRSLVTGACCSRRACSIWNKSRNRME